MATINQPTINPTNKLTSSVIAVAIIELIRVFVHNFFPGFDDASLWTALSPVIVFIVGYYFVKDEANVILAVPVSEQVETETKPVSYKDI